MEISMNTIYEYSLVLLIGIFAGIASLCNNTDEDLKTSIKTAFKIVYTSIYITTIAYLLLTFTDLSYSVRIGISSIIGFLGIDKALETIKKIMELRK